ncbi:Sir2 family NAD-dependent protein deacetylase [Flavihumibacter sp. CACIAM 22H1]|uniref:SIR2 family NAD-dependent protein deacylase n=1 Tax=Flavihumibacter sp. CACIAM 22H1 TaxID=1812911 RepID=UPI0007A91771|nr:Sir2 family NAD-dependent protein deacetylase [Flavihumibacter sp. CACIAM 22H1]KYP14821.1 MAG: NAD-dependent deacylase [Flavihumibacter sp. CACIAM 22H1]
MKKLVVLSGAGISAESGLKTFRDSDGLWEGYAIEEVATPGAWKKNPERVLDFYNQRRRNVLEAKPNRAHEILAELEAQFDVQIITQNIDDLHERAGSKKVLHLHGEIFKMHSEFDIDLSASIEGDMQPGALAPDGGRWRPAIVWFEEPVPQIAAAVPLVRNADIFLVIGTSLVVYPAASLIDFVPAACPVYVVDKKIPAVGLGSRVHRIEEPASTGMERFKKQLLQAYF